METFYGYGTYTGRCWFVGMEEGGGSIVEETISRIIGWKERGARELEDLAERNSISGTSQFFRQRPVAQPTWKQLIRILLAASGLQATPTDVKLYQRDHLGRRNDDICLLELLPLPSPSTNKWAYGDHSALLQLSTRKAYSEHYAPIRAQHIKARIAQYQPSLVVFYGFNWWYKQWWQSIADADFRLIETDHSPFHMGSNNHTLFALVKHPASRGISNNYYHQVGTYLSLNPHAVPNNSA